MKLRTFKGGKSKDAENLCAVRGEVTGMQSLIIACKGRDTKGVI